MNHVALSKEGGTALSIGDELKNKLALTDEETKRVREVYRGSSERVHAGLIAAYKDIGGETAVANGLSVDSLLREITTNSLQGQKVKRRNRLPMKRRGFCLAQIPTR